MKFKQFLSHIFMVFCDFFGVTEVFSVGDDGFLGLRKVFRGAGELFGVAEDFFGVTAGVFFGGRRRSS